MITVQHRLGATQPHVVRLLRVTAHAWGLSTPASSLGFRVQRDAWHTYLLACSRSSRSNI